MRNIPGLSQELATRATQLSAKAQAARAAYPVASPQAALPAVKVRDGVATVRLYDVIDHEGGDWGLSATEFASTLDSLGQDVSKIELRINSGGGSVWDGLAILNTLRSHGTPVTAVVDGLAASAASFIAVACDEVVMMPNSKLMIHDAMGLCIGQSVDMRDYADFLDDGSDNIAAIYAARAGGTAEEWRALMVAKGLLGQWYSADEAVAAGLADRVGGETAAPAAENTAPPEPSTACACGPNGTAVDATYQHKDECPGPVAAGMSYRTKAMHRAVARKHGLSV